jgi:hypothetical protein
VRLKVLALRKRGILLEVVSQIGAAPLDQMGGQTPSMGSLVGSRKILGQDPEGGIDEGKQRPEGPFVSAVGCSRNQDEVALLILKKLRKKKEALMGSPSALDRGSAGVGLVNDHEFRTGPQEVKTMAV